MFYVYILQSEINTAYYIGSCENLKKRLVQHNKGLVKSTRRYKSWFLVYQESYKTLAEARRRERQIKNWKKRRAIEKLIKHFKI